MVREQKFEKAYAKELISIAQKDLESACFLATHESVRVENVFLLAQQALEKALKSVLCWKEMPVPLVHEIGTLVATLKPVCEPPFGYDLNGLSEYATVRRYLAGHEHFSGEEISEILRNVDLACKWCESQLVEVES